jgi:hypothetical protein
VKLIHDTEPSLSQREPSEKLRAQKLLPGLHADKPIHSSGGPRPGDAPQRYCTRIIDRDEGWVAIVWGSTPQQSLDRTKICIAALEASGK